jgi:hemolysin III
VERHADRVAHVLGVTASVLGLVWLVLIASHYPSTLMTTSFALYGGALVSCFFASAAYHEVSHRRLKNVLRVIDHSMIYLMIAGTYTPVALVALGGAWG